MVLKSTKARGGCEGVLVDKRMELQTFEAFLVSGFSAGLCFVYLIMTQKVRCDIRGKLIGGLFGPSYLILRDQKVGDMQGVLASCEGEFVVCGSAALEQVDGDIISYLGMVSWQLDSQINSI